MAAATAIRREDGGSESDQSVSKGVGDYLGGVERHL
jgi:hypothetical protein